MARSLNIHLEGYDELSDRLMALPDVVRTKVVRPGLRAGAKVVAIRVKATNYSRRLRSAAWKVRAAARSRTRIGFQVVSPRRPDLGIGGEDGYWPAFNELGWRTGRPVQGPLDFDKTTRVLVQGKWGTYWRSIKGGRTKAQAQSELQSGRHKIPGRWNFRQALMGSASMIVSEIARECTARMAALGLDVGSASSLIDMGEAA